VEIFTDGACSGNPGVGGYGIVLKSYNKEQELSGYNPSTTNNRMELTAVIKALETLKTPCKVKVFTDSNYVVQGITKWVHNWLKNSWKNSQRKQVVNQDLWKKLLSISGRHDIEWVWVKGHNEHIENERCDRLAKLAIRKAQEHARAK
jgi:ribonuclease HI